MSPEGVHPTFSRPVEPLIALSLHGEPGVRFARRRTEHVGQQNPVWEPLGRNPGGYPSPVSRNREDDPRPHSLPRGRYVPNGPRAPVPLPDLCGSSATTPATLFLPLTGRAGTAGLRPAPGRQ